MCHYFDYSITGQSKSWAYTEKYSRINCYKYFQNQFLLFGRLFNEKNRAQKRPHSRVLKISGQEQASRLIGKMSRLWCHDLTAILHILILIIEKIFLNRLKLLSSHIEMIASLDSLNSDCRSFSNLKTVTGSRPNDQGPQRKPVI